MLPETIRDRCAAIGLKHKDLARLAGLSQKSTGQIMRGDASPRLVNLKALESALITKELSVLRHLYSIHGSKGVVAVSGNEGADSPENRPHEDRFPDGAAS